MMNQSKEKEINIVWRAGGGAFARNLPSGYIINIMDYDSPEWYSEDELKEYEAFEKDEHGQWYQKITLRK